jgi:2-oxoglutarate ferredoxin oxidoreductase subunit beta
VTFNDHVGSTKSYAHTRQFYHHVVDADFIPPAGEIKAAYEEGTAVPVELHDGSKIMLRKVDADYDPTSRAVAFKYLRERFNAGEITTGLLYIDEDRKEMHELMGNIDGPLSELSLDTLHPGKAELAKILSRYR